MSENMPKLDIICVLGYQSWSQQEADPLQNMAKTKAIRRSSQGALSREMIKAAFTKNKRLPTPYEDRLYKARAPLQLY